MASRKFGFTLLPDKDFNGEVRRLKATPRAIHRAVEEELISTAVFIRNRIIQNMRSTPRITRPKQNKSTGGQSGNYNWMIGGKLHIPSSPGYAPAVASSDLIKSILMDVRANEVEVGSNLKGKKGKYPIFLEFGTKNMDARPWLEPAFDDGKRDFFTHIRKRVLQTIRNPR